MVIKDSLYKLFLADKNSCLRSADFISEEDENRDEIFSKCLLKKNV